MAMTKTAKVARVIMANGRGTMMFNDKLVDGTRSLKVWGWTGGDYMMAKQLLEQIGCRADIVTFRKQYSKKMQTRLHVTE